MEYNLQNNPKSLCCTPKTNQILQITLQLKKKKNYMKIIY